MADDSKLTRALDWYGREFLDVDFLAATLTVGGVAWWGAYHDGFASLTDLLADNRGSLYSAIADLTGSLLGFVIAVVPLVAGVFPDKRLRALRDSGHAPTMWRVFWSSTRVLGFTTLVALAGIVVGGAEFYCDWLLMLAFGCVLVSSARVGRCVWVMVNVVNLTTTDSNEEGKSSEASNSDGENADVA